MISTNQLSLAKLFFTNCRLTVIVCSQKTSCKKTSYRRNRQGTEERILLMERRENWGGFPIVRRCGILRKNSNLGTRSTCILYILIKFAKMEGLMTCVVDSVEKKSGISLSKRILYVVTEKVKGESEPVEWIFQITKVAGSQG